MVDMVTTLKGKKWITFLLLIFSMVTSFASGGIARRILFTDALLIGYLIQTKHQKKHVFEIAIIAYPSIMTLLFVYNSFRTDDIYQTGYKLAMILCLSILGALFVIGISDITVNNDWVNRRPVKVICYIGQRTIYIYILHYLCIDMLGNVFPLLKLSVSIGLPLVVEKLIQKTKIDSFLFRPYLLLKKPR